ncbi:hypothetical protein CEUSTIGMA_g2073.t1 [Chlamydomonas eustigma]|uniref:Sfi1 spindle body domain-containing protein n=1 Tax=Chlamydomonas eustigma TaxID=1157962 RepID=A0A250WUZ6_9CHLO|nr:hypothetical protein CEUSTIGMA_g2073.t1 [Chlamydomonas eustigma]|eukprot:GAX74625.1 hypothetical protein CEUSTIGMA_g2073.t1 [Chlamydomonas eustigma]
MDAGIYVKGLQSSLTSVDSIGHGEKKVCSEALAPHSLSQIAVPDSTMPSPSRWDQLKQHARNTDLNLAALSSFDSSSLIKTMAAALSPQVQASMSPHNSKMWAVGGRARRKLFRNSAKSIDPLLHYSQELANVEAQIKSAQAQIQAPYNSNTMLYAQNLHTITSSTQAHPHPSHTSFGQEQSVPASKDCHPQTLVCIKGHASPAAERKALSQINSNIPTSSRPQTNSSDATFLQSKSHTARFEMKGPASQTIATTTTTTSSALDQEAKRLLQRVKELAGMDTSSLNLRIKGSKAAKHNALVDSAPSAPHSVLPSSCLPKTLGLSQHAQPTHAELKRAPHNSSTLSNDVKLKVPLQQRKALSHLPMPSRTRHSMRASEQSQTRHELGHTSSFPATLHAGAVASCAAAAAAAVSRVPVGDGEGLLSEMELVTTIQTLLHGATLQAETEVHAAARNAGLPENDTSEMRGGPVDYGTESWDMVGSVEDQSPILSGGGGGYIPAMPTVEELAEEWSPASSDQVIGAREEAIWHSSRQLLLFRRWFVGTTLIKRRRAASCSTLRHRRLRVWFKEWRRIAATSQKERVIDVVEEERRMKVATQFRDLYLVHHVMSEWRQLSTGGRKGGGLEEWHMQKEYESNNKEEAVRSQVALRFRRLYIAHHCIAAWHHLSHVAAVERQQAAEEQQRRKRIDRFLSSWTGQRQEVGRKIEREDNSHNAIAGIGQDISCTQESENMVSSNTATFAMVERLQSDPVQHPPSAALPTRIEQDSIQLRPLGPLHQTVLPLSITSLAPSPDTYMDNGTHKAVCAPPHSALSSNRPTSSSKICIDRFAAAEAMPCPLGGTVNLAKGCEGPPQLATAARATARRHAVIQSASSQAPASCHTSWSAHAWVNDHAMEAEEKLLDAIASVTDNGSAASSSTGVGNAIHQSKGMREGPYDESQRLLTDGVVDNHAVTQQLHLMSQDDQHSHKNYNHQGRQDGTDGAPDVKVDSRSTYQRIQHMKLRLREGRDAGRQQLLKVLVGKTGDAAAIGSTEDLQTNDSSCGGRHVVAGADKDDQTEGQALVDVAGADKDDQTEGQALVDVVQDIACCSPKHAVGYHAVHEQQSLQILRGGDAHGEAASGTPSLTSQRGAVHALGPRDCEGNGVKHCRANDSSTVPQVTVNHFVTKAPGERMPTNRRATVHFATTPHASTAAHVNGSNHQHRRSASPSSSVASRDTVTDTTRSRYTGASISNRSKAGGPTVSPSVAGSARSDSVPSSSHKSPQSSFRGAIGAEFNRTDRLSQPSHGRRQRQSSATWAPPPASGLRDQDLLCKVKSQEARQRRKTAEQLVAVQDALQQDAMQLAVLHYNRGLLLRCGMKPWHRIVTDSKHQEHHAFSHWVFRCKQSVMQGFILAVTLRRWSGVVAHAVALSGMRLLRQARCIKRCFRCLKTWAASSRMAAVQRMSNILRSWQTAVQMAKEVLDWAKICHDSSFLRKCLMAWMEVSKLQSSKRLLAVLQLKHEEQVQADTALLSYCFIRWRVSSKELKADRQARMHRHATLQKVGGWLTEVQNKRRHHERLVEDICLGREEEGSRTALWRASKYSAEDVHLKGDLDVVSYGGDNELGDQGHPQRDEAVSKKSNRTLIRRDINMEGSELLLLPGRHSKTQRSHYEPLRPDPFQDLMETSTMLHTEDMRKEILQGLLGPGRAQEVNIHVLPHKFEESNVPCVDAAGWRGKVDPLTDGLENFWQLSSKEQQCQTISLNDATNVETSVRTSAVSHVVTTAHGIESLCVPESRSSTAMEEADRCPKYDAERIADHSNKSKSKVPRLLTLPLDKIGGNADPVASPNHVDLIAPVRPTSLPPLANLAKRRAILAAARLAANSAGK